ncbi:MAG: rod shape-determining protein MreC [Sedimentisphaerales bacterium]|nr:rod shape-determining protein MreC [Sedimentisphaerales bacterium]
MAQIMTRQRPGRRTFYYLMILSAVLLLIPRHYTDSLDYAFSRLLGPLSRGGRDLGLTVSGRLQTPRISTVQSQEYEIMNLRRQIRALQEEKERWTGLRTQFGQARTLLVVADVIGADSTSWSPGTMLNRGRTDQVRPGQVVLGRLERAGAPTDPPAPDDIYRYCVIGRIQKTGSHTSTMQLLGDGGFRWPVYVEPRAARHEQWRANGVLTGTGKGQIEVNMISVDHPVQPGDPVLACSDPRYLPTALVVGVVGRCQRDIDSAVFWQITVVPAVDPHALRQVVVVADQWSEELK